MSAAPLKLISSMATREILAELLAALARESGLKVIAEAAGGVEVAKRVAAGEAVDIVVLASDAIDKLIASGKLQHRVDIARSGIAVAVKQDGVRYDISNEAAVKQAVLSARSLSYSTGPSGVYLEKLFERWGILQEIKTRIVVPPPGIPVGSLVARGECELGFQQLTELLGVAGIEILGPLPPAIQSITIFAGGVVTHSKHVQAAHQVLDYLASVNTTAIKQRYGMQGVQDA